MAHQHTGTFNGDFGSLSDDELLQMAGNFGIDTSAFQAQLQPGLLNFGQAPGIGGNVPGAPEFGELGLGVGSPEVSISPEARGLVSTQFDAIRQRAQENLLRLATDAAGRRGLGLIDTPISDPLLRAGGQLESDLGGAEAGAILGLNTDLRNFLQQQAVQQEQAQQARFGLQGQLGIQGGQLGLQQQLGFENALQGRQQQFEQGTRFNQNLQLSLSQFQNQLRQQSFQNRLSIAGLTANTGLGLARLRQPTGSNTITSGGVLSGLPSVLTGLSGVSGGLLGLGR